MKIYIAAPFGQQAEARAKAQQLKDLGHAITHEWWLDPPLPGNGTDPATAAECALRAESDLIGVLQCDLFVALGGFSSTGGKHVERGLAMAHGKRIADVGPPENVFHWLNKERYATWEDFLQELLVPEQAEAL
jgi:hypothetical protein